MYRAWAVWVGLVVALAGCAGSKGEKGQNRGQIGEDPVPAEIDASATVGTKTLPDDMRPVQVSGVGLVYKLQPGTGSSALPGTWRQMLEHNLKKQGFSNLREILDDPERRTSLVLVSAEIPIGARKGEPVDLHISLPEDSKTTSLKGGELIACDLVDYDTTGNLKSMAESGRPAGPSGNLLLGSVWAKGVGPVVAGATVTAARAAEAAGRTPSGPDADPPSLREGRVWAGGRITQTRPYAFLMRPGDQNYRMASSVAERLNSTFQSTSDPTRKVAEVRTKDLILVNVPYAYRHNHNRFLLVARQVPLNPAGADSPYRQKLEEELHDPATALVAALKLEALGTDVRRPLRVALENGSPWVRFAAAESLAYLGHTDGAGELAKLAEGHPALRAYCLKALAASDDAAFTDRLVELMGSTDPVLRYGAFIALRLADESNPAVRGQLVNGSLWVHRVAPGTPGLVHLTRGGRSEVVLFGDGVKLRGPFTLPIGPDFTVSMTATDAEARVSRVVTEKGESKVKELKCGADLQAVLTAVGKLGGGYAEAAELIGRADGAQVLTAAMVVDAIPRQMSVQQLAGLAKTDPALVKANVEVARVGTICPDAETAGLDFASDADPAAKPAADAAPLPTRSREPGRIFGAKKPPEVPVTETLSPVVPVEATAPPEPAPVAPALARTPGTLFPRK